ncbi:photosynthetic NDH subunit of lumenal location 3, chloroplastic [Phoenix dactylifera]|uniref:Photosynthetic NDH subunit of lumenal location 3, chloroplastic n=1 Tax=Phoenix dactylifera TaxID=42345 RepID=A0A8B7C8B9_PHODC|nr:photosynthetic NDH subunit of lumenal location 3, chloroplastic [Phoenix dactylifera]
MAAAVSNLSGTSQILPARLLKNWKPNHGSSRLMVFANKSIDVFQESQLQFHSSSGISLQVSRRASVGLAAVTLFHLLSTGISRAEAENNGLWLTGPIPSPIVTSRIANKETGTRSFLRKGIYMAKLGPQIIPYRLKHYAFDLLALGDLLGQEAWNYVRKYLCLKSTVMYYDFDKLISAAPEEQKQPLTDLANRLFDSVEKLEEAVKKKSDSLTQSCYGDTEVILKEVMARMA